MRPRRDRRPWRGVAAVCCGVWGLAQSPAATTADERSEISWEQRWDASTAVLLQASEAAYAGQDSTGIALTDSALRIHPANYRAYMLRWRIFDRTLPGDELVARILADIEVIGRQREEDDRAYVVDEGYRRAYEETCDDRYLALSREVLEGFLGRHPASGRASDFLQRLGDLTEGASDRAGFFRRSIDVAQAEGRYRDDTWAALARTMVRHPEAFSEHEWQELRPAWEAEIDRLQALLRSAHASLPDTHWAVVDDRAQIAAYRLEWCLWSSALLGSAGDEGADSKAARLALLEQALAHERIAGRRAPLRARIELRLALGELHALTGDMDASDRVRAEARDLVEQLPGLKACSPDADLIQRAAATEPGSGG